MPTTESQMIDKNKAEDIVTKYLKNSGYIYIVSEIEAIEKQEQTKILFGDKKGEIDDIWLVSFERERDQSTLIWYFVFLSATTGEIYGILGPHGHRIP